MPAFRNGVVGTLSLFTSFSTLICCALPALFVSLGAGAALAGIVSAAPQLVWLSAHKAALFAVAGLMLVFSGFLRWRSRNDPCPINPGQASACRKLRRIGGAIYIFSWGMYGTGFFFAFIAVYLWK